MVLGWRRAFCTSIPKDQERDSPIIKDKSDPSPTSSKFSSRFSGFISNSSTPRLQSHPVSSPRLRCRTTIRTLAVTTSSAPQSPKLQCKTKNTPRFFHRSTPSSPRSPSTLTLLKSSLRISKNRCGICLQNVKTGQGTAIFTAECSHSFHFPCIAVHVKKQGSLTCPICNSTWKELHLLATPENENHKSHQEHKREIARDSNSKNDKKAILKVYNDDEPLSSPTSGARFNPIPESDETEEENEEFPGFFVNGYVNNTSPELKLKNVEVSLLPEAAVVSVGRSSETYAVVLKIKAPSAPTKNAKRAPIDLVTVLNVSGSVTSEKLLLMKRTMRLVVSSLSAADRLSIVAFSTASKRLLPLRRMTTAGRRSARRIIDAIIALDGTAASATDALKKAAKVIEDRREKNPSASIMLFSDGHSNGPLVSSTRFSHTEIPVHSVSLNSCLNAPQDDTIAKCIGSLLSVVIQDLKVQLGFISGSAPAEISAVYSYTVRPAFHGSGSTAARIGDLYSKEERELLIELKVPSSFSRAHHVLSVRCSYKDPSTQEPIYGKEQALVIPRPRAVGSSTREIQRLRCLFVTTRAVAESRRLVETNDLTGAHHMLASARALILQSGSGEEFVRGLEAELADLNWKRQNLLQQVHNGRGNTNERNAAYIEDKAEPITPTSAWRAAERLAKVAMMRKSLNRVSDLHGFENARF
ncbi:Zinc finger (C3HC4-type RING finger) family protein [Abeliophyllum distichum]|uniref:Zinc finger (C3HC4-type RING finger) family protein n=1 Tax=Abeliophyllum distichum TaxID=126358 RepID=A0ABD1SFR2_9LAMI